MITLESAFDWYNTVGFLSRTLQLVRVQGAFVPVRVQYRHVQ